MPQRQCPQCGYRGQCAGCLRTRQYTPHAIGAIAPSLVGMGELRGYIDSRKLQELSDAEWRMYGLTRMQLGPMRRVAGYWTTNNEEHDMSKFIRKDMTPETAPGMGYKPLDQILVDFPEHQLKYLGIVARKALGRPYGVKDTLVADYYPDGSEYIMDPPDGYVHVLMFTDDGKAFDGSAFYEAETFKKTWRWV